MITKQELHGNWHQIKGALQEKWGKLTEDDLKNFHGDLNQLIGLIQEKTGESRANITEFCEKSIDNCNSHFSRTAEQVRQYASQMGEATHEQYEAASEAMQHGVEYAQDTIKNRPAESIAVCFGAGLIAGTVLGLLLRNRS